MLISSAARARYLRGFTFVELMATLAIVAILASLAYPSYQRQIRQSRRADAHASLIKLQWAQERWRANSSRYATLTELGVTETSEQAHYRLQVAVADEDGYELVAVAQGAQAGDDNCRYIKVSVSGATVSQLSGPNDRAANGVRENRSCWAR